VIALDALRAVRDRLPEHPKIDRDVPVLDAVDVALGEEGLTPAQRRRLLGRYGADAPTLVAAAQPGELVPIPGTAALWAELRWAARDEGVVHLDDLLLRRVRLGLLLPEGGGLIMGRIRAICQPELGWDDARWEAEEAVYRALWRASYSLPNRALIPDWRPLLLNARLERFAPTKPVSFRRPAIVLASLLAVLIGPHLWRWLRA
jgi:glycerol-3-phosphate dehydrogenase